jgi:tetratricopeptide (TPR) repeat protein
MLFYVLPLAVIIISLGVIALIVVRKFPQLSLIDTEAIPKEKNIARKKEIIDERVRRAAEQWSKGALKAVSPAAVSVRDSFRRFFKRLLTMDRQFAMSKPVDPDKGHDRAEKVRAEAKRLVDENKFGEAEKKLISVLAFDELNDGVYRDLGDLYMRIKRYDRARDTYAFLVKVLIKRKCGQQASESKGVPVPRFEAFAEDCPAGKEAHADIAKQYVNFGLASQGVEDFASARAGFDHAASFEPGNPKHLDLLVEACIMDEVKDRALAAWERLREVNPDNKKLNPLRKKIEKMGAEEKEGA